MSKILYDYLQNSFLLDEFSLGSFFESFSDQELKAELAKYRSYCLENSEAIRREVSNTSGNNSILTIYAETHKKDLPSPQLLKQCALYYDSIIIDDPIFRLTWTPSETNTTITEFIGLVSSSEVNRTDLYNACSYMSEAIPLVVANYAKFAPSSLLHEPPGDIPISYSENYFSDTLPPEIMKLFHNNIDVYKRVTGTGTIVPEPLEPCRSIFISVDGYPGGLVCL